MRKLHHHQTARVRSIDGVHRRMVLKQHNAGSRVLEWLMCIRRGAAWFKCMQSLAGNVARLARAGLASRSADVGQQSEPQELDISTFHVNGLEAGRQHG